MDRPGLPLKRRPMSKKANISREIVDTPLLHLRLLPLLKQHSDPRAASPLLSVTGPSAPKKGAARRASAKYVTVVAPYFGYARQDRKDRPRVSIGAKLVANLLTAAGANRLMTCDLHAGQIQGFFDIPVDHLDGSYIFIPYLKTLRLNDLVFAAPDVGGTGRARGFAKHFAVELVICDKYRKRANEVASMQVIGDVENKDVVIVDDMIDTGGTLSKAADIIVEKGARSVRAICTHPLLTGNAYENIEGSRLEELVVTDTIPLRKPSPKIKVLTVSNLFAKGIRKTHNHESISSLFIH